MPEGIRVLMLGDIIGASGIAIVERRLPGLAAELGADLVIANGENAAGGFGLTEESAKALFAAGVDALTGGNHIWEKKGAAELLAGPLPIARPANYPPGAPGRGMLRVRKGDATVLVVSLQGRDGMRPIDCPFRTVDAILDAERETFVVVDFHAESFQEKQALAHHLDGRVGVVAGTHTHVQTMDERILPGGTAYLGDLGMCGSIDSIIGVRVDSCLRRSLTHMPIKMECAEGPAMLNGALFELSGAGRCEAIRRVRIV